MGRVDLSKLCSVNIRAPPESGQKKGSPANASRPFVDPKDRNIPGQISQISVACGNAHPPLPDGRKSV
jgi:hypothetical protein